MGNLFKILLLLILTPVFGQDNDAVYSIYFDASTDPGTKKLSGVAPKHFGTYSVVPKAEYDMRGAAGHQLVLDESGIYLLKNRLLSISREEIRENSQYSISNGYLHGVVANDSVLVALEDELYYFLIPRKIYLFELANGHSRIYEGLTPNEMLVLTREDNTHYSALYIIIKGGEIILKELNFDQKELDFRTVTGMKTTLDQITTYILDPSKAEWKTLMNHFLEYDRFKVITSED
ncbi:MAG: hypothetical protein GQ574_10150 [Crocinitomix sp.]|nr:hypothetical protein [Crocinitomix sp.]